MLDPIPQHPYPPGTRVHEASEDDAVAFIQGTAAIVSSRPQPDGTYIYLVRPDLGEASLSWPSYFTIPARTWATPLDADPLRGPREAPSETDPAPRRRTVRPDPPASRDESRRLRGSEAANEGTEPAPSQ
ncbi:hypothetical protein GCM10022205_17850 [Spinactinospora alkalitolerans]